MNYILYDFDEHNGRAMNKTQFMLNYSIEVFRLGSKYVFLQFEKRFETLSINKFN